MKMRILLILTLLTAVIILFPKDSYSAKPSDPVTCGDQITYGGITYNTIAIGSQCWFKENLNVGNMITNLQVPDETAPTLNDPITVSKWCFNDDPSYCSTEGGLYTWAEANALPHSCDLTYCDTSSSHQGICPLGWHVPTDADFYTLENYLKTPGETCDPDRVSLTELGCRDAGTKLLIGGSSGFDALGAGNHETNGELSFFDKREPSIHFWTSSPYANNSHAWIRTLGNGSDWVARGIGVKPYGMSVRCVSNHSVCWKGGWKTFSNPTFRNQGDCLRYFEEN